MASPGEPACWLMMLPDELLHEIIRNSRPNDLLHLAQLCRRLNALALDRYFRLLHFRNRPSKYRPSKYIYMSAIRKNCRWIQGILLDVTGLKADTIFVDLWEYMPTDKTILSGIITMDRLVKVLPTVRDCEIKLALHDSWADRASALLLEVFENRSLQDCTEFSMTLSPTMYDAISSTPPPLRREKFSLRKLLPKKFARRKQSPIHRQPQLHQSGSPPLHNMLSFRLVLNGVSPPEDLSNWLIHSANSSTHLQRVRLTNPTRGFLPQLTLPSLTDFTLSESEIVSIPFQPEPPEELVRFLAQNPTITTLTIERRVWDESVQKLVLSKRPAKFLPNLTTILAHPSVVHPFLSPQRTTLRDVGLDLCTPSRWNQQTLRVFKALSTHQNVNHLNLVFRKHESPTNHFWLSQWWTESDINPPLLFPRISKITIDCSCSQNPTEFTAFEEWIRLFPNLNRFSLEHGLQVKHAELLAGIFEKVLPTRPSITMEPGDDGVKKFVVEVLNETDEKAES